MVVIKLCVCDGAFQKYIFCQHSFLPISVRCFHQVFCVGRSVGCSSLHYRSSVWSHHYHQSLRQSCFPPPGGSHPPMCCLFHQLHMQTLWKAVWQETTTLRATIKWIMRKKADGECKTKVLSSPWRLRALVLVKHMIGRCPAPPAQDAPLCRH